MLYFLCKYISEIIFWCFYFYRNRILLFTNKNVLCQKLTFVIFTRGKYTQIVLIG